MNDRRIGSGEQRGPPGNRVRAWMDLMETCEQLVLAGLRHKIGPDGDLSAAWHARSGRQAIRRERELAHMLSAARRPGTGHAV